MGITDMVYEGKGVEVMDGTLFKMTAAVNIKAFYNELHDWLVENDFVDQWAGNHAKKGEFVKSTDNFNRTGDMFETEFVTIDAGSKRELEVKWTAVKYGMPNSQYGKVVFKFDLSCRDMKDKEILVGNQKKVVQTAGWEFRNKLIYSNSVVEEYFNNIPLIGKSPTLKKMTYDAFYAQRVEDDIIKIVAMKMKAGITGLINKHFT